MRLADVAARIFGPDHRDTPGADRFFREALNHDGQLK